MRSHFSTVINEKGNTNKYRRRKKRDEVETKESCMYSRDDTRCKIHLSLTAIMTLAKQSLHEDDTDLDRRTETETLVTSSSMNTEFLCTP